MTRRRRLLRETLLGATCAALAACATTTASVDLSSDIRQSMCRIFRPITWSPADTDETIAGVKEHNAAWKALCERPH